MKTFSYRIQGAAIIMAALFFDQLTKCRVVQSLLLGQVIPYTSWFNLVFRTNKGISFSFFSNPSFLAEGGLIFFITAVLFWLIYQWWIAWNRWEITGYSLIIGGALGNLTDRFFRGAVVDFLEFHLHQYYWPAFNIADSCIVGGVILILGVQTWQSGRQNSSR